MDRLDKLDRQTDWRMDRSLLLHTTNIHSSQHNV